LKVTNLNFALVVCSIFQSVWRPVPVAEVTAQV